MASITHPDNELEVVETYSGGDYSKSILELHPFEHASTLDKLHKQGLSFTVQAVLFYLAGRAVERKSPVAAAFADSGYPEEFVIPLHIDHNGEGKGICSSVVGFNEENPLKSGMVLPQFSCGDGSVSANHTNCYVDMANTWVTWNTTRPVYTSMLNFEAMEVWHTVSSCNHNLVSIIDNMRRPSLSVIK